MCWRLLNTSQQKRQSAVFARASLLGSWGFSGGTLPPQGAGLCSLLMFLHALQRAENGWKGSATGYWTVYSWPGQD